VARPLRFSSPRLALAGALLAFALAALAAPTLARTTDPVADTVALAELPREAQRMHDAIKSGGPFQYAKDGSVFANRERLLPRKARGWYREYTVKTPGSRDRGARRIVCGGEQPKSPDVCFYTADHYASFRRIVQ